MLVDVAQFQDASHSILGVSRCLNASVSDHLVFNLGRCEWMQIGEVVALASFFRSARAQKLQIEGRYIPDSNIGAYLSRMDFFKVQNIIRDESFTWHDPQDRFLTLSPIRQDVNSNEIPAKLRNIVVAQTSIDESLVGALDYAFGEIVDNVYTHSRTPIDGLVGAQFYPVKSFVEFCVADGGIGVAETLRTNPAYSELGDCELLAKAFENGVGENTSGFGDDPFGYGCGFGLTFAARLVEATGGDLWMASNTAGFHLHGTDIETFDGYNITGTVICMRIPSNVSVTEDDLLRNGIKDPYGWNPVNGIAADANDILW